MIRYGSIACAAILAWLPALALAQSPPPKDALDVTMRVITDPTARVPDEVVHRIPLPLPRERARPDTPPGDDAAGREHGQQTAEQARELGREIADQAREQARENAEQRGEAGRAIAEEARRRGPPVDPPSPPVTPPSAP